MAKAWSDSENDAIVQDYFDMLEHEQMGLPFSKAEHRRALMETTGRSHGSIEFKHSNISAVMEILGLPHIVGYRPRENFQRALFEAVEAHLKKRPVLYSLLADESKTLPDGAAESSAGEAIDFESAPLQRRIPEHSFSEDIERFGGRDFMAEQGRELTAGCLFGGMGGLASGLANAGFTIRWANDENSSACTTFRFRLPSARVIEKDVRELSVVGDCLPQVDVLAAGFPCQSFSLAGARRGFEDPRGKLFFEIPRLLKEFEPEKRPSLIVLENVPNLLYGADGSWFDEVRRALRKAGYWFRRESCWITNVKDSTELPQDRERLFMVAASRSHFTYNPFEPPHTANREIAGRFSLSAIVDRTHPGNAEEYLPKDNRYFKMIDREMSTGESDMNIYQLRRSYVREKKNGLCPTLTANMGIGGHNVPFVRDEWGIRRLSVNEVAILQGFDGGDSLFPDIPVKEKYRLLGNAVCVRLAQLVGRQCAEILSEQVGTK